MTSLKTYVNRICQLFENCQDFNCRLGKSGNTEFAVIFLKSITSRDFIAERILQPIFKKDLSNFDGDFCSLLECPSLTPAESTDSVADAISKGEALVLIQGQQDVCFATLANVQLTTGRSVDEPDSDVTVRGPKTGFVENSEKNTALLRQYIRTPKFKIRSFTIGEVSSTTVLMCYVEGRAESDTVESIAAQLASIKASVITDSANLAMLLNPKNSILPTCGSSEKVDKVASKLMSGRIAIIVDGSPFVITLPYLFIEGFQAADDYLHTPFYATFIRFLRLFAFISAIFAPAILCTVINWDFEIMPPYFYGIIYESRKDIPLSFFWEIIAVLILFEVLREVGVRMPRTVGDAVGIVGSIILGNTAVEAGIVSSVGVITVAFSAVCAFITPAYMYIIVLTRLLVLVVSEIFGIAGLVVSALLFIFLVITKKSFGCYYLYPIIPFNKQGFQDSLFSFPKKTLGRKERLKK